MPGYNEIIERNQVEFLLRPGDLTIRNGDIAVTRWGDLMLNDEDYSAFFKLVQEWRFNYPTLKVMFATVFDSVERQAQLERETEACFPGPTREHPHPLFNPARDYASYHRLMDEQGAVEMARGVYAGSVVLVINKFLQSFRGDIAATDDEWAKCSPRFSDYSLGQLLEASANNFRHNEEWARTRPPSPQQLRSIRILAGALQERGGHRHQLAREICPEVLQLTSEGDFDRLERLVFGFANDLLKQRQARLLRQ